MVFLGHMLDMAHKAHEKVHGLDREAFEADGNLRYASAHLIQVIGEAAQRVPSAVGRDHPEIPWREVTGMRYLDGFLPPTRGDQ